MPIAAAAVVADEEYAVGQIQAALREIHHAAHDDGEDLHDHPPVDARVSYTDHFHQALELLREADQRMPASQPALRNRT